MSLPRNQWLLWVSGGSWSSDYPGKAEWCLWCLLSNHPGKGVPCCILTSYSLGSKWTPRWRHSFIFILGNKIKLLQYFFFNQFWDGSVKTEKGTCSEAEQHGKIETLSYSFLVFVVSVFSSCSYSSFHGFLTPPHATTHFRRLHVELDHISTNSSSAKRDNA